MIPGPGTHRAAGSVRAGTHLQVFDTEAVAIPSERAAESAYAAQKMARLGIVAMVLCRPAEFRPGEIPSLRSLVSGLLKPAVDKAG